MLLIAGPMQRPATSRQDLGGVGEHRLRLWGQGHERLADGGPADDVAGSATDPGRQRPDRTDAEEGTDGNPRHHAGARPALQSRAPGTALACGAG